MANRRRIETYFWRQRFGWDLIPVFRIAFFRSTHIIHFEIELAFLCYAFRIYFYLKDTWTDHEREVLSRAEDSTLEKGVVHG